jgi:tetratricopeptide (TPR) repeat protein
MKQYPVFVRLIFLGFFCGFVIISKAGCPGTGAIWKSLLDIEAGTQSIEKKLQEVEILQKQFISCNYPKDSVYARILHRMGVYQYQLKKDLTSCINNTFEAIEINRSGSRSALPSFVANSYSNLGLYYKDLQFYKEALMSFDSAVYYASRFKNQDRFILMSRLQRSNIYVRIGDFQKSIDEASLGLQHAYAVKDSVNLALLFNERAQSLVSILRFDMATADLAQSRNILASQKDVENTLADNYRIQANLYKNKSDLKNAFTFYLKAIESRKLLGTTPGLADDMIEMGNFLTVQLKKHQEAMVYYQKALVIINNENNDVAKAQVLNNIGALYKETNQPGKALTYYQQGLTVFVTGFKNDALTANPSEQQVKLTSDKQLLFILLANKAESFLLQYQSTKNKVQLTEAGKVFLLTDKVIDEMRYGQDAETTKLYWRKRTRNFFGIAITAAFESGDAESLLYFMEKSRAILLNDKLNELGAQAYLPAAELAIEQDFRISIHTLQQRFSLLNATDKDYNPVQTALLTVKSEFEKFIRDLEKKFPAYYQYKYSGININISKLKTYLSEKNATYISYFETDTAMYTITVSAKEAKIFKLYFAGFKTDAARFLQLAASKELLNSNYPEFLLLARRMHDKLFAPLGVSGSRIILSPDELLLPFDAFVKDEKVKNYLLYGHSFSYTYSASYLLKNMQIGKKAAGNFLGIAPEIFAGRFSLADLKGSAQSVTKIKQGFSTSAVLTNQSATRANFLSKAAGYRLLHIYAHAIADSTLSEPRLFLSDSTISLSEQQLIQMLPAQLVFLAACETNIGRQQNGEGIYSLARGFAAAGVPATVATLWKADNEAMYQISESFYKYIKEGKPKDEALRLAKIDYVKSGRKENELPFYWASTVLLGNTDSVVFASSFNYWYVAIGGVFLLLIVFFLRDKQKREAA